MAKGVAQKLKIGGLVVEITWKRIKQFYLKVDPQKGTVRVSAPDHLSLDQIRQAVLAKRDWIQRKLVKVAAESRETVFAFEDGEEHFLWGKPYSLLVKEAEAVPGVTVNGQQIVLQVKPGSEVEKRRSTMERWYGEQLREALKPLLAKWCAELNVTVTAVSIRAMKTRWGSCTPKRLTIRVNTLMATKPKTCLDYLVLHELLHIFEPSHSQRFYALLDQFMPNWRAKKEALSQGVID
jgi:predicted metal-dependent hydrolase